jgi:hypothetical protein
MGLRANNQAMLAKVYKRQPSLQTQSWLELAVLQGLLSCKQIP